MSSAAGPSQHSFLAEQGKLHASRGDHVAALMQYRQAIAFAVREQVPEIVCRHYLECAVESLEHMGAHGEVLEYCDRAILHYQQNPPQSSLASVDLGTIHQRRGVALLKLGRKSEAAQAFETASGVAKSVDAKLPLAETLRRWLLAQLTIGAERLRAEQDRHHYFSMRTENVKSSRPESLAAQLHATAQLNLGA